jgi:molecular chaperone GrpE
MMNESDKKPDEGLGEEPGNEARDTAEQADTPWGGEDAAAAFEAALNALREENDSLKDQLLRALAEMENLRQRTAREIKDARSYSIANFARDVLNVSDNLHRAMAALPESERAAADPALSALLQGVEMTERDLQATLEKHEVRRIDPQGERFDPHFHQAMFEVPDPSVPAGQVVQVVQAGYVIGDRVLRPAMVAVAKGGPKPAPVRQENDEAAPSGETGSGDPRSEPGGEDERAPRGPEGGPGGVGSHVDKSA